MTGHRPGRRRVALLALVLCVAVHASTAAVAGAAAASGPGTGVDPTGRSHATTRDVDASASAVAGTAPAVTADTSTLHMRTELALTPDRPGEVRATLTFAIPDRVTALKASVPADATVVDAHGFSRADDAYAWDGETASPTLTFDLNANRTGTGEGPLSGEGSYLFVDAGSWALVRAPGVGVRWTRRGTTPVEFTRDLTVAGEGTAGDSVAFLGPTRVLTRTAHGQTFRLVVPAAADMAADPDRVFDTLADASGSLRVGSRDEDVLVVVAPTENVDWAVRGLETGGSDFWVRDTERVTDPANVWVHEYVHTRQAFTTTDSGRWFVEASATWYAALLTLEQGHVGFRRFVDYLSRGADGAVSRVVLADPGTWVANANYLKGGLVAGDVDRRLRVASDHEASLQTVFSALNGHTDPVSNDDLLAAVENAAGGDARSTTRQYTTTKAVPDVWDERAHGRAFGQTPALMEVTLTDEARVDGPYRNVTTTAPTLAVGERLHLTATVRNDGGTTGGYEVPFRVDGETVATRTGRLDPNETATLTFARAFDAPGTYTVGVGTERLTVSVRDAATPRVARLELNRTGLRRGGAVLATLTVENPTAVPAAGTVTVTLDGDSVARRDVTLPPGASTTLSVPVRVATAGTHTVAAGDVSVAVEARKRATSAPVPGFGFGVAVAALALLLSAGRSVGR